MQKRGEDGAESADTGEGAARASSSPAESTEAAQPPGTVLGSDTVDGWSSETTSPIKKR
ncbi:MAG: hypothetical protein WDN31_09175 [Hyphomicrobium sp.]